MSESITLSQRAPTTTPLLAVENLTVEYVVGGKWTPVVENVSFAVEAGKTLGIVGESGSGKTVSCLAVLGLIDAQRGRIASGSIRLDGEELTGRGERSLRTIRGQRIGMIFQQPTRSLDPAFTVGHQIAETLQRHRSMSRRAAWQRAVELLDQVRISEPHRRAKQFPHEFSGGMCQRAMIAMAISCEPELLIADEPTTALDVTVQASILDLLRDIQAQTGLAILFVSHDLGVIAEICDDVVMMYAGQVVETGTVVDLFTAPRHPYTEGLLGSIPKVGRSRRLQSIPGTMAPPGTYRDRCRFAARCGYRVESCAEPQSIVRVGHDQTARCCRADSLELQGVELR